MEIQRREVETRDGRVAYYEAGDGPQTVLCIHSWTRSPRVWFEVLEATPPGHRAIAIDLLLESEKPHGGYTLAAMADRVAALLDALAIDRAAIAGHSLGGGIALDFALRYPARVDRLVLVCVGPHTPKQGSSGGPVAAKFLREKHRNRETMANILRRWFYVQPSEQEFGAMVEDAMRWPEAALLGLRASQEAADFRPRLSEIVVPTLVIRGEHDHGRPLSQVEALARGVPNGKLVTVGGTGHTPMQEAPAEFNFYFWTFLAPAQCGS